MKILIIARGIPNQHDPQEGCFEWDQAKALASLGHEVVIMAVDGRVRKYWRPLGISKVEKDNVTGYKLFYFPTAIIRRLINYRMGYFIEQLLTDRLYKHIVKLHGEFDIVHSHYLTCSYLGVYLKEKHGVNLVATEHWSELKKQKLPKEIEFLGSRTYANVDKLISVSKHLGESIKNHFNIDYQVVYNLIDTSNLSKAIASTGNNYFKIVAVGSLLKIKGFDILINSFAKLGLPNIILKIFGEGPERKNLENLIRQNGLTQQVILCGRQSKNTIYEELHTADLYILSSRSENFSVALIEATANGVPAIGTLCGGVQEYPIDICKIPVEDEDAMCSSIKYCYSNSDKWDRIKLQQDTLNYFSPKNIAMELENIYKSLISK